MNDSLNYFSFCSHKQHLEYQGKNGLGMKVGMKIGNETRERLGMKVGMKIGNETR